MHIAAICVLVPHTLVGLPDGAGVEAPPDEIVPTFAMVTAGDASGWVEGGSGEAGADGETAAVFEGPPQPPPADKVRALVLAAQIGLSSESALSAGLETSAAQSVLSRVAEYRAEHAEEYAAVERQVMDAKKQDARRRAARPIAGQGTTASVSPGGLTVQEAASRLDELQEAAFSYAVAGLSNDQVAALRATREQRRAGVIGSATASTATGQTGNPTAAPGAARPRPTMAKLQEADGAIRAWLGD
ncbi:MAG: hypothetical protein ACKVS8_11220 [Phycisphaerales bacterium]